MLGKIHMPWICLLMIGFISKARGMSIDQTISDASSDVHSVKFFNDINDRVVPQELDVMVLKEQHDASVGETGNGREKRRAIRHLPHPWPNNTIPYHITAGVFSQRDLDIIHGAMDQWQNLTCIQFREKTRNDKNFINFNNGWGCYSYVGMIGGSQTIALAGGCRHHGVVVHEIGHAVGLHLHYEQNRPDTDKSVKMFKRNIPSNLQNFLGFRDVEHANWLYKCDASCTGVNLCPDLTYRGKDCKCYCKSSSQDSPVKVCKRQRTLEA